MRGRHSQFRIQMTDQTRTTLQSWLHRRKTPHGQAKRARALLLLEQGQTFVQTASQVGLNECHVRKWAKRFLDQGVVGLSEKPRPGRPDRKGRLPFIPRRAALVVRGRPRGGSDRRPRLGRYALHGGPAARS